MVMFLRVRVGGDHPIQGVLDHPSWHGFESCPSRGKQKVQIESIIVMGAAATAHSGVQYMLLPAIDLGSRCGRVDGRRRRHGGGCLRLVLVQDDDDDGMKEVCFVFVVSLCHVNS